MRRTPPVPSLIARPLLGLPLLALLLSGLSLSVAGCDHAPAATAGPAAARPAAAVAHPAPSGSVAAPNGVDYLFAEMMVMHHGQAVAMSRTLLARPDVPPRARAVAGYIAQDQQREIDEMNAWLRAWGRPGVDPDDPAAAAMHGGGDPAAHGMLTPAELARAASASGPEATRLYLRQMIQHHLGAITMARSALDDGRNVFIRTLAKHIVNEQSAENDSMRALLDDPA